MTIIAFLRSHWVLRDYFSRVGKMPKYFIPHDFEKVAQGFSSASFIHIPKTGGSYIGSLRDEFGNRVFHSLGHSCCLDPNTPNIKKYWPIEKMPHTSCLNNSRFKKDFVFAMVRNPFDMLVSYYYHDSQSGWESCRLNSITRLHPQLANGQKRKYDFSTFESFIHAFCDPDFLWHKPALKDFLFFQIFHNSGDAMIPFVGKYEYIDFCSNAFCNVIYGNSRSVLAQEPVNTGLVRKSKDYRVFYTDKMIEMINQKCALELEMFGYSFEGTDERAIVDVRPLKVKLIY